MFIASIGITINLATILYWGCVLPADGSCFFLLLGFHAPFGDIARAGRTIYNNNLHSLS
jgi:hypothetical protein